MAAERQMQEAVYKQAGSREGNKHWVDLFRKASRPSSSFQLRKWNEDERAIDKEELRNLGYCLVGYILGRFPGRSAVENVRKSWNVESKCSVHDNGWMIFMFNTEEDRNSVLMKGPYETLGAPWLLKKLPPFFKFHEVSFSSIPTWIRLPGLPLECWSENALGKLASFVGDPIAADECTATMAKTSFARILVEVDVSKPLVREIRTLLPDGDWLVQQVLYEREPQVCSKCKKTGHNEGHCRLYSTGGKKLLAQQQVAASSQQTEKVQREMQRPCSTTSAAKTAIDQSLQDEGHLGSSSVLGSIKESSHEAVTAGSSPATEPVKHAVILAEDISIVAEKVTGSHLAETGQKSKQITGALAGLVQHQGAAATIQQKQGSQPELMQPPADVQLGNTSDEAEQAVLEAEFPPLAAGETGRRKKQARNAAHAKPTAAIAKELKLTHDLQVTDAQVVVQPSDASNPAIPHASSDSHKGRQQHNAGSSNQGDKQSIKQCGADSPPSAKEEDSKCAADADHAAAAAGTNILPAEVVPTPRQPPQPKWRQNRTTRSAKKRGPSQASPPQT